MRQVKAIESRREIGGDCRDCAGDVDGSWSRVCEFE